MEMLTESFLKVQKTISPFVPLTHWLWEQRSNKQDKWKVMFLWHPRRVNISQSQTVHIAHKLPVPVQTRDDLEDMGDFAFVLRQNPAGQARCGFLISFWL